MWTLEQALLTAAHYKAVLEEITYHDVGMDAAEALVRLAAEFGQAADPELVNMLGPCSTECLLTIFADSDSHCKANRQAVANVLATQQLLKERGIEVIEFAALAGGEGDANG